MYEQNGIMYADDPTPLLTVKQVRPMNDYKLLVRFSTGEEKEVDIASLLDEPAFRSLRNPDLYKDVYIDYGTVVWCNGTIDIAPEYLYSIGVPLKEKRNEKLVEIKALQMLEATLG
jgi:hypothetical protein